MNKLNIFFWKCMINIIFGNNTMIRILAIELLNRILLLIILIIKSLLKKLMVGLDNFSALFSVPELNKV
jgi:multisubunit Na+/H+ antiporter MnhF subunit